MVASVFREGVRDQGEATVWRIVWRVVKSGFSLKSVCKSAFLTAHKTVMIGLHHTPPTTIDQQNRFSFAFRQTLRAFAGA